MEIEAGRNDAMSLFSLRTENKFLFAGLDVFGIVTCPASQEKGISMKLSFPSKEKDVKGKFYKKRHQVGGSIREVVTPIAARVIARKSNLSDGIYNSICVKAISDNWASKCI